MRFENPALRQRSLLAVALLIGVGFGVVDRVLALGSETALDVSNVSSLWLALAFAIGTQTRTMRWAALAGAVCLLAAVTGYYGYMHFSEHQANRYYLVHVAGRWLAGAFVGGPVFAMLGAAWAHRRSRIAAICLAGAFLLEPLLVLTHARFAVRAGEIAFAAFLLVLLLVWKPRSPALGSGRAG